MSTRCKLPTPMLIIKLAAGWDDWVAYLIALPIALIISGITITNTVATILEYLPIQSIVSYRLSQYDTTCDAGVE